MSALEDPTNGWESESQVAQVRRGIADPMGSAFKDPETLRLMLLSVVDVFIDEMGGFLERVNKLDEKCRSLQMAQEGIGEEDIAETRHEDT